MTSIPATSLPLPLHPRATPDAPIDTAASGVTAEAVVNAAPGADSRRTPAGIEQHTARAHEPIAARITALIDQQVADNRLTVDQASDLKGQIAPAARGDDASAAGDATAGSFGDQLDALTRSLDRLRTSLAKPSLYGGNAASDGGLVFDRLA